MENIYIYCNVITTYLSSLIIKCFIHRDYIKIHIISKYTFQQSIEATKNSAVIEQNVSR